MSLFFLGFLIAGIIGGTIAYNCYTKRESTERTLRTNIHNLEYNLTMIKKESEVKVEQLNNELKKAKEENKRAISDIDMLSKDISSLKKQLAECHRRLQAEEL
jgi:peptidoglycan hydrolase CwlO-like protein